MIPDNCNSCGLCCTLGIQLSKKEIAAIKELGYEEEHFLEPKEKLLKRVNGRCVFLIPKKGGARCEIYEFRPRLCRDFPGEKKCAFSKHPIFRISGNYKKIKKELENQTGVKAP
ncbi:YkgJ family cysteine cluster protein [Candidatus Woesearchaeota archaeon]|nr:YkgJ family cysteine cluster protein [Candidatus Woesearchaeota archaeon]